MQIYQIEFYFSHDSNRTDLDFGREMSRAIHEAVGGDIALHNLASEHGLKFCGRSWERMRSAEEPAYSCDCGQVHSTPESLRVHQDGSSNPRCLGRS